jgi:hypothetical protein
VCVGRGGGAGGGGEFLEEGDGDKGREGVGWWWQRENKRAVK